ncbi:mg2+ transporter [Stagonosporopsis vannaccii]|nr:mg2+ transporter [Stagonosporopsis vannaccii]
MLRELIGQFVPELFAHTIIQRCWGSLETVREFIDSTRKSGADIYQHEIGQEESYKVFLIKKLPSKSYMELHEIPPLGVPIEQCRACRRKTRYSAIEDAVAHLKQEHAPGTGALTDGLLAHWLVTPDGRASEQIHERLLDLIEVLRRPTRKLLVKAIEVRSSVADKEGLKGSNYLLPTALVKAAEKVFQFIYYSAHSVETWRDRGVIPRVPKGLPPLLTDQANALGVEYFAKAADVALSNARDELMMMAYTGNNRDPVLHISTTPESNVLAMLVSLIDQPILKGLKVGELYRQHLVRLRYEASRRPSKRILGEVYLWKEEMEVVESVAKQQADAMRALGEVIDSSSFRITTQVRIDAWKRHDTAAIKDLKSYVSKRRVQTQDLYKQADKLAESLRHNIAIAEEGNSKAILIFTLVTIVFLPLSFVSSVFGMNTVDVRDMESSQTLFWAVALPVTAIVGGLSLVAAYGGPYLQQHIRRWKGLRIVVEFPSFRRHPSDDEEQIRPSDHDSVPAMIESKGRRRRDVAGYTTRQFLLGRKVKPPQPVKDRSLTLEDM